MRENQGDFGHEPEAAEIVSPPRASAGAFIECAEGEAQASRLKQARQRRGNQMGQSCQECREGVLLAEPVIDPPVSRRMEGMLERIDERFLLSTRLKPRNRSQPAGYSEFGEGSSHQSWCRCGMTAPSHGIPASFPGQNR